MALQTMGIQAVAKGVGSFVRDIGSMNKSIGDFDSTAGGLGGRLGGLAKGIAGVAAATAALGGAALIGAGGALAKLAIDAAPLEGIGSAFEGLTSDIEGGSSGMLAALQKASNGMVSNRDLMLNFNTAAQLVGKDFAQQLPDAMQYLGKISAATGQDMGYLLDSLTRGVGRLSPMILDNLNVQVDLTQAYEDWAKANGKTVDSMSKADQQAAVMAATIEQLAANTADMPEVAGTASQSMAALKTQFANTKDEIGLALLPILTTVMGRLNEFASNVLPQVVDWVSNKLVPALQDMALWFSAHIIPLIGQAGAWIESTLIPAFQSISSWISSHGEEVKAGLIGLGVAVASVLIPAFISWAVAAGAAALATIAALAPILAIGAAVGLLALAWQKDFGGIRTTITAWYNTAFKPFIEDKVVPAFQKVGDAIKAVIDWVKAFIDNLKSIKLPDWLVRHSPSPLELVFKNTADDLSKITQKELPRLNAQLTMVPMAGGGGSTYNSPRTVHMGDVNIGKDMSFDQFDANMQRWLGA